MTPFNEKDNDIDWFQSLDRMTTILLRIYLAYHKTKGDQSDVDSKRAVTEQFRRDMHFLVRRLADPEFARYLNERLDYTKGSTKKRGIVVEKNINLLAEWILEDIAAKKA
jgi:hypothetical protein